MNIPSGCYLNVGEQGAGLMNVTGGQVTVGLVNVGGLSSTNPSTRQRHSQPVGQRLVDVDNREPDLLLFRQRRPQPR